jgi:hypothetical protein
VQSFAANERGDFELPTLAEAVGADSFSPFLNCLDIGVAAD